MIEQWKNIPNYENLYQISNLGRIKSLYNYKRNGTNILVPRLKKGYYTIGLRKNGIRKWYLIHISLKEASKKENRDISTLSIKCRNMTDYKGYIYSYKEVV